ncbi:pirin family protein [Flavobacterium branchiarum]|uniref:Pirin family protein n=1 Tax=Flavobacterium branchiarum TaxID=1114870 RepID=A0ABV5FLD2_9FLAO|nr:pirin family protein [Flavobacterium branchiarum]MDN3674415.1 pirin family protein [Flavobacterium branchiarum]
MKYREIEKILTPQNFTWVGDAFYTTSFVGKEIPRIRMSPFFAVGYNADIDFEAREIPRGVGAHPHKGFETVTIAYKGKIEHKDSKGNHGVIGEGDVQWMTAGSGILHQEYHEQEFARKGGTFQMVQMWVNLPAKDKETNPQYQDLLFDKMTKVPVGNDGSFVNVIAGDYLGHKGKATTFSPMNLYNAYLNKGAKADFSFSKNWNTAILVIEGGVKVNNETELKKDSFAMFENDTSDSFSLEGISDNTIVLIMSGKPLNEPIAHYGPFVMNTQEQITKAIEDFQAGKFGTL